MKMIKFIPENTLALEVFPDAAAGSWDQDYLVHSLDLYDHFPPVYPSVQ